MIGRDKYEYPEYIQYLHSLAIKQNNNISNINQFANYNSLNLSLFKTLHSWMSTVEYFTRAVAVIGPHGGAFGNIFFCSQNTTIIEFNVPWKYGEWLDGKAPVRDLFYSLVNYTYI